MTENQIHPDYISAYIQDNGLLKNNIDLANMVNFFAELIIQECADKANTTALAIQMHSKLDARKYVGASILKSFGVKL